MSVSSADPVAPVDAAWDVIVVGSGMGGMSTAAALSRTGHKVLLLEQRDTLGGLTHNFSRNGFRWDVGLHYLSGVAPGQIAREILDWLCDTPIDLEPMGSVYDILHIGDNEPLPLSRPFEAQALDLKERFPNDTKAVDNWFEAVRRGKDAGESVFRSRSIPHPFGAALEWWNRGEINRWCGRTTAEVAAEITDNPELASAFFAQWADHGGMPSSGSFAVHAMVSHSYLESGAWYPVGGSSVFAEHILPVIAKAGGEARAGVRVERLLMDGGRVIGVRTANGDDIHAPVVASDIGARETVDMLLPSDHGEDDWVGEIRAFGPNICHFSLFLGFEGDVAAAGATKANHWLYPTGETDAVWRDVLNAPPPGMFVSFASLKDPTHDPGVKQTHFGEILAWTDWSTVARWADSAPGQRCEEFDDFEEMVKAELFEQFRTYFPKLAGLVVYRELATPLATVAITGHRQGGFYGLEVTPDRMLSDALRMKTPIEGLYLSGQDVTAPGIPGAMWGGLLCAATIDPKVFMHLR